MMVALIDGEEVDSASEAWRFECECRYILNLPTLIQRREWLYGRIETSRLTGKTSATGGLLQRRGEDAVKIIEAKMMELWKARQNSRVA